MNEQGREADILKAEEAIHGLHREANHYSESAEQIKEALNKLGEANAAVKEAREEIGKASETLQNSSGKLAEDITTVAERGAAILSDTAELISNIGEHITTTTGTFQDVARKLEANSQTELLRLDELIALARTQTEQIIESNRQFSRLTSLVKWVLIPVAIVTAINTVLLIIRTS